MKKIYFVAIAVASLLGLSSCNKYLDLTPRDSVSDNVIWASTESAEYSVNYIYTYLLDINSWQCVAGMTEALTDQLKYGSYNYNSLAFIPSEISYGGSTLTTTYVDAYLGYWGTLYTAIRRTNQSLYGLKNFSKLSEQDAARLEGELRFVRGWLYFELLKRYKEVIIYDEDMEAITKDRALDSEEAGWNFVQADLEFAGANLPVKASANGRIDRGMAYALESRAMLYAKRYSAVIDAADKVASLGYTLQNDYSSAFTQAINGGNSEAILQYTFDYGNNVTHSFDFYYGPAGDYSELGLTGGGYGTPTQEMVESYELASGGFPDWSEWHTTSGTTSNPPYEALEPRFQATILYNGASWKNRRIEPFVGGLDGWATWNLDREPKGKTVTGYYLRKGVDESHDAAQTSSTSPLTLLRYGEVLLNKAEAAYMNNDAATANSMLRQIRSRVGLPYSDKSGDALWAAIRQERKVELAYEGLWYWDLRRWGVAAGNYPEGLSSYQVHGLKIVPTAVAGQFQYTYVSVDDKDRNFPERMYRFPLPTSELSSNSLVSQYSEWK